MATLKKNPQPIENHISFLKCSTRKVGSETSLRLLKSDVKQFFLGGGGFLAGVRIYSIFGPKHDSAALVLPVFSGPVACSIFVLRR